MLQKTQGGRVRVYMACSLDGYIAGVNHDLHWLHRDHSSPGDLPPAEDVLRFEKFLGQVGVILMGRTTFDVVQSFDVWPYGQLPLLVATHRALKSKQQEVRPVSGSIHELVEQARAMSGDKDIYLDGCALVQQALNAGLVDEMTLTFIPILLGGGIRLFEHLEAPKRVQFASSRPFDQGALQVTLRL